MGKDRLELQLHDAANIVGVNLPETVEIEGTNHPIIYMGYASGENLCLGKAISEIGNGVRVIFSDLYTRGTSILVDGSLLPAFVSRDIDYCLNENTRPSSFKIIPPLTGNAINVKKYSENKILASIILKMGGIPIPEEIHFRQSRFFSLTHDNEKEHANLLKEIYESDANRVRSFVNSLKKEERIVIKPFDGKCGNGISILTREDIEDMSDKDIAVLIDEGGTLVQKKIDSYPIYNEGGDRMDWNIRALVTWDHSKKEYVIAGIIGRIDKDGSPVNRSISADYISLEDIGKKAGWSSEELNNAQEKIEEIAKKSVNCLVSRSEKNVSPEVQSIETQSLAGVDIILDEDMNPVVLEVNDSNSGCMYELVKLKGIEALYPIAASVITKATLRNNFLKVLEIIEKNLPDHMNIRDFEADLLAGKLKIEETDSGHVAIILPRE